MQKQQSLSKLERIKSKLLIDSLFDRKSEKNMSFLVFPIKTIFSITEDSPVLDKWPQIMVSVSSKKFKKAVDRNLIKRRMREAYRINKVEVSKLTKAAFIYVAPEIVAYSKIEKAMIHCLLRLKSFNKTS